MADRMIFVNLPVKDLGRSMAYFRELGFEFDERFVDEKGAGMIVHAGVAYVMLLTEDFFRTFTQRQICDTSTHTEGLFAVSAESREAVDSLVDRAIALGGADTGHVEDHGFMYGRAFYDLDGHHWEATWMDVEAFMAAQEGAQ